MENIKEHYFETYPLSDYTDQQQKIVNSQYSYWVQPVKIEYDINNLALALVLGIRSTFIKLGLFHV